jgi:archaemetzincin
MSIPNHPSRFTRRRVLAVAGMGSAAACGRVWSQQPGSPDRVREIHSAMEKLRPLMVKKAPPQPGEWLASHPEKGQLFNEYRFSNPNRPTKDRTTLYVLPLGDFAAAQEKLLERTMEFAKIFFGLPVKKLAAVGMEAIPPSARRVHPSWGVKQILTRYVREDLLPKVVEKDAVATLALTATDLWPGEGWNFVFGEASLTQRTGVWSVARFGDPDKEFRTVLRRTLGVASHETGHLLGIKHCIAYECGMNGANHLEESDKNPLPFCMECDAKLWWACQLKIAERLRALEAFARKEGLTAEADAWGKFAAAVASA